MAAVGRAGQMLSRISRQLAFLPQQQVRNASIFLKDYKPGPYPKTEEERRAAARKYNMIYEDYEPYPDTDMYSIGDYPKLPPVGDNSKDPYANYDFPAAKRNYGEPINYRWDLYIETRYDVSARHWVSREKQVIVFFVVSIAYFSLCYFFESNEYFSKLAEVPIRKQYASEGVHYTFEPAD